MKFQKSKNFFIIFFILIFSNIFAEEVPKTPGSVIGKKEIKIGISKHYPPLNFHSGKMGLDIDLAKKLGEFLDAKVELVPLDVHNYIPSIKEKKVDIIIAGLSRNLVRAKKIWFSIPYITITPGVLVSKQALPQTQFGEEFEQSPITTLWDLTRLSRFKFAVKKGSSYEVLLNEYFPESIKIIVKSNDEGFNALTSGKVDGFVHDSLFLQYHYNKTAKYRSSYLLLQGGERVEKICIGLPFGDLLLKNQVNIFISEMIRQGYIDRWLKIYNQK